MEKESANSGVNTEEPGTNPAMVAPITLALSLKVAGAEVRKNVMILWCYPGAKGLTFNVPSIPSHVMGSSGSVV